MKVMINKTKAILSSFVTIFSLAYSIYYFYEGRTPEAPFFLLLGIVFGILFFRNASQICIDQNHISKCFFGIPLKKVEWSEIQELGLIGENVFNHKKEKTGDKYIYFSPVSMNAKERFDLIVQWPPKNMLYMEYSEKALTYCMTIWGKELKTYNVEDIFPNSDEVQTEKPQKTDLN